MKSEASKRRLFPVLSLLILTLLVTCPGVQAQTSGAQSLLIDPSVRASGTGRSSSAVFWGGNPNYWANPALLGYHHGVRFEHGKTQLVPDLANDVYFRTDRITVGVGGWGIAFSGSPIGQNRLDYGESEVTDAEGNLLGVFDSYEEYTYLGLGLCVLEAAHALVPESKLLGLSRFGDVAVGWSHKQTKVDLAPRWATEDGVSGTGEVTSQDWGVLFRLTPINSIGGRSLLPFLDEALEPIGGLRVDLSYARSMQNSGKSFIPYEEQGERDAVTKLSRKGWAVHAAVGLPEAIQDWFHDEGLGLLADSFHPLISVGTSWDRIGNEWPDPNETDIENSGWEITLVNVLTLRGGDIDDRDGDIRDSTSGWGLGFQLADLGGVRYDSADVPQARSLDRVDRWELSLFVDPLAIHRSWNGTDANSR